MVISFMAVGRVILTSRKLGDTFPSWLELFLELVLKDRWVAETKNCETLIVREVRVPNPLPRGTCLL